MTTNVDAMWHSDPTRRHQYRFWDGEAWTQHVSDNGVASIDPLPRAVQTRVDQALFAARVDEVVMSDLRKRRLVVDGEALYWKDKRVALADVTELTYYAAVIGTVIYPSKQYRVELRVGKDRTVVLWDGRDARSADIYDRVVDLLRRTVVTRLVEHEFSLLEAERSTVMGGISFSRKGMELKKHRVDWPAITALQPASEARVVVWAGTERFAVVDFVSPNAPVVLGLIRICVSAFGSANRT